MLPSSNYNSGLSNKGSIEGSPSDIDCYNSDINMDDFIEKGMIEDSFNEKLYSYETAWRFDEAVGYC